MKHFVRVVMEKQESAKQLDESVFPKTNLYETAQGATVYEIPLSRQLTEEESDEYAQRLANYMFEQGYEDFMFFFKNRNKKMYPQNLGTMGDSPRKFFISTKKIVNKGAKINMAISAC